MLKAVVAHGGGPTAVLNASLAGLIEGSRGRFSSLCAARFGLFGIVEREMPDLLRVAPERVAAMAATPGSALGSSRRRLEAADFERVVTELRRQDIRIVF